MSGSDKGLRLRGTSAQRISGATAVNDEQPTPSPTASTALSTSTIPQTRTQTAIPSAPTATTHPDTWLEFAVRFTLTVAIFIVLWLPTYWYILPQFRGKTAPSMEELQQRALADHMCPPGVECTAGVL
eukprot:m.36935 g.36935  ORF g.36935 m.36935 type:complete len:128 (+) comp10050_c0_seq4:717-1100(+)